MPRQSRKISPTGVYHVMLRGINRNRIFNDEQDCRKFEKILREITAPKDRNGVPLPPYCHIYAYCLMTNHIHLLLSRGEEELASTMKRIGVAYVSYYNKRNDRLGPLFHDRFRSEPVDSSAYFISLLKYIHFNPVEAGIVDNPDQYRWSSWHEYLAAMNNSNICARSFPFSDISWDKMCELVLDANSEHQPQSNIPRRRLTDAEAKVVLKGIMGEQIFGEMSKARKKEIVNKAFAAGVGLRQLARISNISYGMINSTRKQSSN